MARYANEYHASKAALNMLMVQYAGRLGRERIKVLAADPRFLCDGLYGGFGGVEEVGGDRAGGWELCYCRCC